MIVAIAGATGLTGSYCLQALLTNPSIDAVYAAGRRTTGVSHPKLTELPLEKNELQHVPATDAFICCLGTTMRKAGSKAAFLNIDLHLPLHLAAQLRQAGCSTASVVSSMGANAASSIFYTRTKGEMEEGMQEIGFKSLNILRPSIISGERKEMRPGELIGKGLFWLIQPLLLGRFRHYRSVHAATIGKALVGSVLSAKPGVNVYLSNSIAELIP